MIHGHVFKQDAEERGGASGTEKKKIILEGFGFLYPPPPKSYFFTLQSISVPRTLPPIISPILSGDFQKEMVEIKDFSSSDVSSMCHVRSKNTLFCLPNIS